MGWAGAGGWGGGEGGGGKGDPLTRINLAKLCVEESWTGVQRSLHISAHDCDRAT